ncbi:MAG: hypothetical protein HN576_06535 [Bacteriovoracaceae bacterium]|nr:hypothetical protein [Bacteriovoracaceae bacterium]
MESVGRDACYKKQQNSSYTTMACEAGDYESISDANDVRKELCNLNSHIDC